MNGLLLAGGESRRMGYDKAALEYPTASPGPIGAHLFGLLRPFCRDVFVSRRPGQPDLPFGRKLLDETAGIGPAAGLLAAYRREPVAWLVLACDFPFAARDGLAFLIERRNPAKAATCYASADGRPEPFFAIWEPAAFRALVGHPARGARAALESVPIERLAAPAGNLLANVNSRTEARSFGLGGDNAPNGRT